jgi:hypothetical protein
LVSNSLHQGGFTSTVTGTDTVSPSSPQLQVGVVEQQQTTVGERELDITKDLSFLVVLLLDNSILCLVDIHEGLSDSFGTCGTLLSSKQELHE